MTVTNRIGTYLFMLGIVLIFLFIFSDIAGSPSFGFFFFGLLCLILGFVLWWKYPAPPPSEPSERFRLLKKIMKKEKKEK
jgi:hypothetical protein